MVDDFDELILLLLRTDTMSDAVLAYEEETGASHWQATAAVKRLARENGLDHKVREAGQLGAAIVTALTLGVISFIVMLRFS